MSAMHAALSFFAFIAVICLVSCKDSCEIYRVENGVVLREDLISIRNSSGHQTGTKAIYLQADTSSSADSGTSLYIRCRDPYRFQGDKTSILAEVTCTNGRWVPFPVCLPPPCYKSSLNYRGLDKSGERIFFHGESFEPKCEHGYRIAETAEKRIFCENGQWTGNLPPCTKEAQCKLPEKPDFGEMELVGKSATVGSVVIFTCEPGRTLVGSFVSKCNNLGEWTTPAPKCVASCRTETLLDFEGMIVENRRSVNDGDWLRPRCDEGFEVADKDDPKIYCRDGKWEGNLPPCFPTSKGSCKTESLSIFPGLILGDPSTLDDGEWIQPQCDEGYDLAVKDNPKIYCRDGKWEGNLPPCSPSQPEKAACQTESLLDFDGFVAENRLLLNDGESLDPRCDEGFQVADKDDPKIYCRDGTWVGNLPPCSPSQSLKDGCKTSDLLNFDGIIIEDSLTLEDGESLEPRCDVGFAVVATKIYCLEGIWMGNFPPCLPSISKKAPCDTESLYDFDGLIVEDRSTLGDGEWFQPRCDNGYERTEKNDPKIYCRDGKWEGSLPPCSRSVSVKAPCDTESLYDFDGLIVEDRNTLDDGEWFQPRCEIGFKLIEKDDPKIYCRDGKWEGNLPPCSWSPSAKASCETASLASFTGLIIGNRLTVDDGEWFRPSCEEGYELADKDDPKIYCRGGRWQGSLPPCSPSQSDKASCKAESLLAFEGLIISISTLDDGQWFLPGCQEGFELSDKDDPKIYCRDGNWEGSFPPCSRSETVKELCEVPSVLNGDLGRYQQHRVLRRKTIFKKMREGATLNEEEILILRCHDGYVSSGKKQAETIITCLSGKLSPEPKCVAKGESCGTEQLLGFQGLILSSIRSVNDGEWIQPMCAVGYQFFNKNASKLYCRQGSWEGTLPPCHPAPCLDNPPVPVNGRVKPTWWKIEHGAHVEYECLRNYDLTEEGNVVCSFGKWTGSVPSCRDKRCYRRDLPQKEGVDLSNDTPVQSFMKTDIRCIEGYTLKYPAVLCVYGEWQTQNELSPCQESECQVSGVENGEILKEISVPVRNSLGKVIRRDIVYEAADIGSFESSGTTLYVSCRDPYRFLVGEEELNNITCRRGSWLPSPQCVLQSTCLMSSLYDVIPPEVTPYVDESTDSSVPSGFVVKLGCAQFEMVYKGNSSAVCDAGGMWNVGPDIQCSHGCERLKKKSDSELIVLPKKRFYGFGESVTFSCPEGMSLTKDIERITCLKYGWEPSAMPDCQ